MRHSVEKYFRIEREKRRKPIARLQDILRARDRIERAYPARDALFLTLRDQDASAM